jgi:hypothetical protein
VLVSTFFLSAFAHLEQACGLLSSAIYLRFQTGMAPSFKGTLIAGRGDDFATRPMVKGDPFGITLFYTCTLFYTLIIIIRSPSFLPVVWFTRGFLAGIEGRYVRPWSLNLLFCRRGFGLVFSVVVPLCWRCCQIREVTGSTPGLDFYLLCEPNCVSLRLFHFTILTIQL